VCVDSTRRVHVLASAAGTHPSDPYRDVADIPISVVRIARTAETTPSAGCFEDDVYVVDSATAAAAYRALAVLTAGW
jgi:hypothetical protein